MKEKTRVRKLDNKPELLSPAGNFECLKLAISSGANAVYFGAKNFNARAKADNFGQELKDAIAYCHIFGAKAYLTLNTVIHNDEIEAFAECAKNALEYNIDAFIVQDFGALNIIKNCFDDAVIHASTQMVINNYLGAKMAEEMGIKRVVLARETSLEDINLIKRNTNLEIEYFIQGALCVCLSGNCYMSSKLFAKSGNRGECMQPCRLPYTATLNGKEIGNGYLLSAKDISMQNHLKQLFDAGVCSYKIEGRLKRPAYVAGTTKIYRDIIDNNFQTDSKQTNDLKKLFNRGNYTASYLGGNGNIIDKNIQGHQGIFIGKVLSFSSGKKFNEVYIKTNYTINKNDALKFIKDGKENASIVAMDITRQKDCYKVTTTAKIAPNSDVHLILDAKYEEDLLKTDKKMPIKLKIIANNNKNIQLLYNFNGIEGKIEGDVCEKAKSQPLSFDEAKSQMKKLSCTPFYIDDFRLETDGVFVKKSTLNSLRNQMVDDIFSHYSQKKYIKFNFDYIKRVQNEHFSSAAAPSYEIEEKYNSDCDILIVRPKDYINFDYKKYHTKMHFYISLHF